RIRGLVVMGILISPAFLADEIGYGVQRLFLTADQIAAKQAPPDAMPAAISVFHVACVDADAAAADQSRWTAFAAQQRWPSYPEAGAGCFKSDRALFGVV